MNAEQVCDWVAQTTGRKVIPSSIQSVSGGCINEAWKLDGLDGPVFLKTNRADRIELFAAEMRSLEMLRESGAIRVPEPFAHGLVAGLAVFAMEWISLNSCSDPGNQAALGRAVAKLHEAKSADGKYGAVFNNHIGATEQRNSRHSCWADFFVENRLRFQIQLSAKNGKAFLKSDDMLKIAHEILSNIDPVPSLLHGDLWSGNVGFDEQGAPVIFDPASYFGDPETDIAFTRMFGGFEGEFYRAYRESRAAPEDEYFLHQIYNLYHILNHYNLFGGSYCDQAELVISRILSGEC